MFDTMKVARKMKEARIARNLTQMNLADEMGVSYQAVSNWERGNSMPDIAKLEQLCQILQIGIDELLGADTARGLTKLMHQDQNVEIITAEEIREFAPMLHPDYVKKVVDTNLGREEENQEGKRKMNPHTIAALAPFLSQEDLDSLVHDFAEGLEAQELMELAPFLGEEALAFLAKNLEGEVDFEGLKKLAPFLSGEALDELALRRKEGFELGELARLAPHLGGEALDELALRKKDGFELGELVGLAPHLGAEALNELALRAREGFGFEKLAGLAPFLDSKVLKVLVKRLGE